MQEIRIKIGQENKPQIEKLNKETLPKSIFGEQYKYSLDALEDYLEAVEEVPKEVGNEDKKYGDVQRQTDVDNNIFAFIGDRGSGKTSCMMSFAELLKSDVENGIKDSYKMLKRTKFYALDLIDPSFFDDKHNILAIFLATLFKEYKKTEKGKTEQERQNLLALFHDAQRDMAYLMQGNRDQTCDNSLLQLSLMSASVDLKQTIYELVNGLLQFVGVKDSKLLVVIDDIDLNSSQAEEMAEQIRKYLVHENIVVLIALKLEQMELIKHNKFKSLFVELQDNSNIDVDLMVERYMAKFIPQGHRIYMPEGNYYMDAELIVDGDEKIKGQPVKTAVLELIFTKTRYLFYNTQVKTSYILPRNLRDLIQLIEILYRMDPYNDESNLYNKTIFKKYLFGEWMKDNLDSDGRDLINELLKIEDYPLFNKSVLEMLKKRFPNIDKPEEYDEEDVKTEIKNIFRQTNRVYNISLGDSLSIIDLAEKTYTSDKDTRFLFMLRTLYSMRMYESYDEMTDALKEREKQKYDDNEAKNEGMDNNDDKDESKGVIKYDLYKNLNAFDKLVGGRFINTRLRKLLPTETSRQSRADRKIDLFKLRSLINECNGDMKKHFERGAQINNGLIYKVRMAEFFILCTARDFSTQNSTARVDYYDPGYRSRSDINYDRQLDNNKNGYFDINAFFYNITRMEKCYKRFVGGEDFYAFVNRKDCVFSLRYAFKCRTLERDHEKDLNFFRESRWLSFCSFRNAEILQAFYDSLDAIKYRVSEPTSVLAEFFKQAAKFKINTYDLNEGSDDNKRYLIQFPFLNDVADWLQSLQEKSTFNSIYSPTVAKAASAHRP